MGYIYDTFISYKHDVFYDWVHEIFFPLFKGLLDSELAPYKNNGEKSVIFIDERRKRAGDGLEESIEYALTRSKCLITILSAEYFTSSYCRSEFAIMNYRQNQLGLRTSEKPRGLIIPFIIQDGECFPKIIDKNIWLDCKNFRTTSPPAFKLGSKYIAFEEKMFEWVKSIAHTIAYVSEKYPWKAEWIDKKWTKRPESKASSKKLQLIPLTLLD